MSSDAAGTRPSRRDDVERICQAALDRDPHSRAAFLARACAGDSTLRRDVESLLAQEPSAAGFMEAAALDGATAAVGLLSEPGAAIGESIGPYHVMSLLGVGGMGEVYRARDTRLDRDVALKVLPKPVAQDPTWRARFHREAKILASLSHPNIAAIYGFEESSRFPALALEIVEGPTLADRIAEGPITLDDALPLARQIAEALEAAHDHGVIHRDLKPANIKLRPDGIVKVLDFGLAKAVEPTSRDGVPRLSMTATGMILGTAAYMSPEQARGRAVDRRSDIWAFGCVLYEMLTGRRAFAGADVAATMIAVLSTEPDWNALPANTPAAIRRLLRRSLTRDLRNRLADASTARLDIEEACEFPRTEPIATNMSAARARPRARWMMPAALASIVAALSVLAALYVRDAALPETVRFLIDTATPRNPYLVTISPDGRTVAYVAQAESGTPMVYLRPLGSVSARPLPGTEDAFDASWSPDSRSIVASLGFGPNSTLRIVDVTGGPPQTIARCGAGTLNRDGVVICWNGETLSRVSAAGGSPTEITTLDKSLGETGHRFPHFLPDGRHFLYLAWSTRPENRAIYVGALDSDRKTRIMWAESRVIYVDPGFLLFHRQGTLFAQPFDASRFVLHGEPVLLAEAIVSAGNGNAAFAVSPSGTLVYRVEAARQLAWFDRQGRHLGDVGAPGFVGEFALAPDGKRVAFAQAGPGASTTDIWILDVSTGISSRVTTDPASESEPVWSPDGQTLLFASDRRGDTAVFRRALRDRDDVPVLVSKEWHWPDDWSRDGRYLLINEQNAGILALSATGDQVSVGRMGSDATIDEAKFSPDGRWVAYASTESGQTEIRVASFPDFETSQQVSTGGGNEPQWRDDGTELFYLKGDGDLMVVRVSVTGTRFDSTAPSRLFTTRAATGTPGGTSFAVSKDGSRFLVLQSVESRPTPITVILNWTSMIAEAARR